MILIVTSADDVHADAVCSALDERGAAYVRFDPGDFPARVQIVARSGRAGLQLELRRGEELTCLQTVRVLWYRRPHKSEAAASVQDAFMRGYVASECALFLEDVWTALECVCVPALPDVMRRADLKLAQLRVARRLGFVTPETLLGNAPEAVLRLREQCGPQLISKLPGPGLYRQPQHRAVRFTERVRRADLGYLDRVALSPVLFQPYVDKQLEVRVTVVGEQTFACEIGSQRSVRAAVDFRRYDFASTPHTVHALPSAVAGRCVALTHALGLTYSTLDLILTPAGDYVFLELNPNGQYLWIEDLTGLPISAAIAELLSAQDEEHRLYEDTSVGVGERRAGDLPGAALE
jgi:hypothetical protein